MAMFILTWEVNASAVTFVPMDVAAVVVKQNLKIFLALQFNYYVLSSSKCSNSLSNINYVGCLFCIMEQLSNNNY